MKNKPTGYRVEYLCGGCNKAHAWGECTEKQPLNTHPAKTLTDEEIISSAEEAGFNWSEDKGIFVRHSNGSWIGLDSKMVDFARAILRKANEK